MPEADGLVIFEFIPRQRTEMTFVTIAAENQTAHFIAHVIKENHPGRARSVALNDFPVDDPGMLSFLVGNHHSELAVSFHDVDTLNINFRKFLFL
jgi:hypothetical protein